MPRPRSRAAGVGEPCQGALVARLRDCLPPPPSEGAAAATRRGRAPAACRMCHSLVVPQLATTLPLTPGFMSGLLCALQRNSQAADTRETAYFAAVKDCRLSGSFAATRLRFARLCAFLRLKSPLASAGNSIFVWRLSEADLHEALHEAPVELVPNTALSPALREHQLHVISELQRKLSA